MSQIKKFSYQDTRRRWLIPIAVFLMFFIELLFLNSLILSFKFFLPYYPVSTVVFIIAIIAFFAGNYVAKFFYSFTSRSRIINIVVSFFYIVAISFYFLKLYFWGESLSDLNIYVKSKYFSVLIIVVPSFLCGVLNNYFLNISTGDFLDDKNLLFSYVVAFFLAISAVFYLSAFDFGHGKFACDKNIAASLVSLLLFAVMIFINQKFNPEPLYAKQYIDEEVEEDKQKILREDLFYTYLNFTYIITYLYLGQILLNRFYVFSYKNMDLYIGATIISMVVGFFAARLKKLHLFHIISESLFPLIFFAFMFILFYAESRFSYKIALSLSVVPSFVYGFALKKTFDNILERYDHQQRYRVVNFALFIIPVPVIFILSIVSFTNIVFFLVLYIIAFLNLIIPALFVFNLKISFVKKFCYLGFILTLIFTTVFFHIYLKLPFNLKKFYNYSENFEILQNTNYNLPYIVERGDVKFFGEPVFYLSNSRIKNYKRAVAALSLYEKEGTRSLVIDSNQSFFKNSLYTLLDDFTCLDPVPERFVDDNRLPVSGLESYFVYKSEIVNFILNSKRSFDFIIDIPNIFDQKNHSFRFSRAYYNLLKNKMNEAAIYGLVVDLKFMPAQRLESALKNLNSSFAFSNFYLFSDVLVVLCSDSEDSLQITANAYNRLADDISSNQQCSLIFYDNIHLLENMLPVKLSEILQKIESAGDSFNPEILRELKSYKNIINSSFLKSEPKLASSIESSFAKNSKILSLLSQMDYAETIDDYEKEIDILLELKKFTPYNDAIKNYVNAHLSYKDKYYQGEAVRFEKLKRWDEAVSLYKAILKIDKNNFEANYRLALLYITLQDLNQAFKYLDDALKIDKNNPDAIYQMGVLLFSTEKFKDAIKYFETAKELNLRTPLLFMYLGLSYEKIGDTAKALECYEEAASIDPEDLKIRELRDMLKAKLSSTSTVTEAQKTNMIDDEQGERISLPVNKKAINARIRDDEQ